MPSFCSGRFVHILYRLSWSNQFCWVHCIVTLCSLSVTPFLVSRNVSQEVALRASRIYTPPYWTKLEVELYSCLSKCHPLVYNVDCLQHLTMRIKGLFTKLGLAAIFVSIFWCW